MATATLEGTALAAWVRERQERIEVVLDRALPIVEGPASRLHEAMRYAVLGGGKRMRPLLVYAAGEALHAEVAKLDAPAASVELIHAYSLLHDDLPCMDNDVLRRGKPTGHVAFGEATALLAADALQALAFFVLAQSRLPDAAAACAILAHAAGAPGMVGGQQIDLNAAGTDMDMATLERMHRMKTGALIEASVQLGARAAGDIGAGATGALSAFASAAGLAFQVVDDVLDVEGSSQSLGKTAGKDAEQGKVTYVSLLGLDGAKRHAQLLREQAHAALDPFGAAAQRLRDLADWIVSRTH